MSLRRFLDGYARWYRLTRALGAAVFLFGATAGLWWMKQHPPLRVDHTRGTVTEVITGNVTSGEQRLVRVRLSDGREAQVVVPRFAAEPGRTVPVRIEVYGDGPSSVVFDLETWVDDAAT